MKIKNSELKIPIILNLIIVFALFFDLLIPSNKIIKEEFLSFYNTVTNVPKVKGGGGKDIRNILECKSGNLYYLVSMPDYENNIKEEQEIYVKKTILFSKVKSLKVSEKEEWSVSLLSNNWIIFSFIISTFITLVNFCFTNKYLDVLLSFSSGYIFVVTGTYLFYFS